MSKKLGEISYITKLAGFEHTKYIQGNCSHTKKDGFIPLFIGKTVRDGHIDKNFDWYIDKKISDSLERSKLTKKCIVMPYVGSVGDLAIFDASYEAHLGSNIAKIEIDDNCGYDINFIYHYLKSPHGQKVLLRDIQGAIQKNITMGAIRDVELPNISLKKQIEISKILDEIDDKIKNNNSIISELESMAKTLYDYWFLQFEFPNEEGKPYKSSGGKMVWNEELKRDIPEGWTYQTFGDILSELESGDRPKGGAADNGVPSIGAENILGIGKYDYSSDKYIPEDYFNSMKKGIVKTWDVLMYKDGAGIGQSTMFGDGFPYEKCAINSHAFILRSRENFYQNYLYLTLGQKHIEKLVISLAMKAAQPGLNQPAVKSIPTLVPSDKIIKLFNEKIDVLFHKIFECAKENQQLKSLRDFLLPMLMNGQVTFTKEGESIA